MRKIPVVILILFHTLFLQVHSKTIIENVTVSSDFIQNLFFEEIRSNLKLADIDFDETKSAEKCFLQLGELAKTFPSYEAVRFVDSWGKFPSGLLSGHTTDLGNYDQCVEISAALIPSHGVTNGQYCFASFPNLLSTKMFAEKNDTSSLTVAGDDLFIARELLETPLIVRIGVCIPEECSAKVVNTILQKAMGNALNGKLSGSTISNCSVARKPDFRTVDIIVIVFFSFIGLLMLLSTFYDYGTTCIKKKPVPLLLAFSVISNGRKLFTINTVKSPNSITCLTGIRVFSTFWIINCHNYALYRYINVVNLSTVLTTWSKQFLSMFVFSGGISVDSFFFLSGLLLAWSGFKEMDKTKGKLNIAMMYIHRYIRLTPALAAVILVFITINNYIGNGPFRSPSEGCEKSWWITLLYVQNYASAPECVQQAWYLACDTQLYFISPLILIPMWKWGKKFIPAVVFIAILSIGCVMGIFIAEGYTNILGLGNPLGILPRTYKKTHTRCYVWLIGIVFGYLMHINRNKTIRLSVIIQLVGWIVSLGIMFFVIFGPYFIAEFPYDSSVALAATFEPLKRIFWVIALGWIVFVCHFGYGGLVNSVLSHPFWQPIGRLTYCMYLVHMLVQEINFGITRTDVYFSDYTMVLQFWNTLGITFILAIVLLLSFEAPILVIEKAIFGSTSPKSDRSNNLVSPSSSFQSKEV